MSRAPERGIYRKTVKVTLQNTLGGRRAARGCVRT